MLFYFTGTGNCLYVARQIEENPVSIPQAIRSETLDFSADRIGIVAPVYGHEVPQMVKAFMHRARFHTDYIQLSGFTQGRLRRSLAHITTVLFATSFSCRSLCFALNFSLTSVREAIKMR